MEYYRIKDLDLDGYFKEAYNSTNIEEVQLAILRFLNDSRNDMKELSTFTVGELLDIENIKLELETSYEPHPYDSSILLLDYEGEETILN